MVVPREILAARKGSVGLSHTGTCYRPHLVVLSPTKTRAFTHAQHVLSPTLTRAFAHTLKPPNRWIPTSHGLNRLRVTILTESLTRLTVLTGLEFQISFWMKGKGAQGDLGDDLHV